MLSVENQEEGVGNLVWCKCGQCRVEHRAVDCLCCKEVDAIDAEKVGLLLHCVLVLLFTFVLFTLVFLIMTATT